MDQPAPTVYLLYGDNELEFREAVDQLRQRLGDPATADLNIAQFNAPGLDFVSFSETCSSIPFLAPRRLVVLNQVERFPKDEELRERMLALLDGLPPSTALVLIERTDMGGKAENRYKQSSIFFRWCADQPERAYIRRCAIPQGGAFAVWVRDRCADMGGRINPHAASSLADFVDADPLLADQELTKLITFVGEGGEITASDVEQLTPFRGQSDIFEMVDAIGSLDSKTAQLLLHRLLETEEIRYVFSMIVRQFRLLILAREALDRGVEPKHTLPARTPDFVARKMTAQARNFHPQTLEGIYQRLLTLDLEAKLSQSDLTVELDRLLAALTQSKVGSRP
jgi:DNA polymerase-3 subunit delta